MGFRRGIRRGPVCHPHEPNKNQMACAAPVAARRQAACRALPRQNHRRALKFSSCQVAGLPRRLPRKSQATLSHSVGRRAIFRMMWHYYFGPPPPPTTTTTIMMLSFQDFGKCMNSSTTTSIQHIVIHSAVFTVKTRRTSPFYYIIKDHGQCRDLSAELGCSSSNHTNKRHRPLSICLFR